MVRGQLACPGSGVDPHPDQLLAVDFLQQKWRDIVEARQDHAPGKQCSGTITAFPWDAAHMEEHSRDPWTGGGLDGKRVAPKYASPENHSNFSNPPRDTDVGLVSSWSGWF